MPPAAFVLSIFGDEIATGLREQLETLQTLGIGHLELRTAWGVNVADLSDNQVREARGLLAEYRVGVACIGSPIGKSPIALPLEREVGCLRRVLEIGLDLGCDRVRVFSFYPPEDTPPEVIDSYVAESARRLAELAELAARHGATLVLENEQGIVGDTPERCRALLAAVDHPALRFAWDSANFVLTGVDRPVHRAWSLLGPYTSHVHIKDAVSTGHAMRVAGAGEGQIAELLAALWQAGYQGYLALEPHLKIAAHSTGFSGPDGAAEAAGALRSLLAQASYPESALLHSSGGQA